MTGSQVAALTTHDVEDEQVADDKVIAGGNDLLPHGRENPTVTFQKQVSESISTSSIPTLAMSPRRVKVRNIGFLQSVRLRSNSLR
jgi:hypothetical protein